MLSEIQKIRYCVLNQDVGDLRNELFLFFPLALFLGSGGLENVLLIESHVVGAPSPSLKAYQIALKIP